MAKLDTAQEMTAAQNATMGAFHRIREIVNNVSIYPPHEQRAKMLVEIWEIAEDALEHIEDGPLTSRDIGEMVAEGMAPLGSADNPIVLDEAPF